MLSRYKLKAPEYDTAPFESSSLLKWLWFFIRPYKVLFWALTINRFSRATFFMGVQPFIFAKVIEAFENKSAFNNPEIVWNWLWLYVALSLFVFLLLLVCTEERKLGERISRNASLFGFTHLNKLSANWHEKAVSGSKLQKILTGRVGMNQIIRTYYINILQFIASFFGTVIAILMFGIDYIFIFLFLGMMVTYTAFTWWTGIFVSRGYDQHNQLYETLIGKVYEFINSSLTVKIFNIDQFLVKKASEGEQEGYEKISDVYKLDYIRWIGMNTIGLFWIVLIIVVAINMTLSETLSVAALAFITYQSIYVWWSLEDFSNVYALLIEYGSAMKRLITLLQQPVDIKDDESAKALTLKSNQHVSVEMKNIDFSYTDLAHVFSDLNFHAKPAEKIGVIGPSGSGKSTLVKLLLRFYDPQKGTITLNGQDVRHVTQSSVRQAIAVIPQDIALFNHPVIDNIRYGRLDATDEEVIEASKKAHAHEFISELPDGYETLVGERGVKLSGGQRQRIAIARAILKDAPILILDEATSALDSESEKLIQESLHELMEGKTVIAIAHRLSTIAHLDRLIVMDQGQIVEDGSHKELLKKKDGLYAKLWNMQSGGFLGE